MGSWHVSPRAPSVGRLIDLIREGFLSAGGNFDSGRDLPMLMKDAGLRPRVFATVIALGLGDAYLRLPLQFATALRPRLEKLLVAGFKRTAQVAEPIEGGEADAEAFGRAFAAKVALPGNWRTAIALRMRPVHASSRTSRGGFVGNPAARRAAEAT